MRGDPHSPGRWGGCAHGGLQGPLAPLVLPIVLLLVALSFGPSSAAAQGRPEIDESHLQAVFPSAERFSELEGSPPVYRALQVDAAGGTERTVGYVFLTSDIPPESYGYTAPIQVLVGMDLDGTLTGARVMAYRESLRSSRGDFLGRPGIVGQFSGKSILDPFRVRQDVENITGATITVSAMALGVRNAARRVAVAYLRPPTVATVGGAPPRMGTVPVETLERLTFPEMVQLGLIHQIQTQGGADPLALSLAYLRDPTVGELLIGPTRYPDGIRRAGGRAEEAHQFLLGINGAAAASFRPQTLAFAQGGDTIRVVAADLVSTGILPDGTAQGEFRRTGILLVSRALDPMRPFTFLYEGAAGAPPLSVEVRLHDDPAPVAAAEAAQPELPVSTEAGGGPASDPASAEPRPPALGTDGTTTIADAPGVEAAPTEPAPTLQFDFSDEAFAELLSQGDEELEESVFARTWAQTSWARVGSLLLLLALATWAFASKRPPLRWIALAGTLGYLGFFDRGFLSVSHILAGISVGPGVYLTDLPLLILVLFTVGTTLFVGRVFCGYLCPFGAIQDLLEKVVPARFRREFPRALHERALLLKYLVLAVVVAPVVLGMPITLFHLFEPFGTVFFWSTSIVLWAIAGGILLASAVVPRFYCRYACPLGAALAIGSLLAPFRIRRVDQCGVCKVCEQRCPTGAIRGPKIDFKECVRCNVCEVALIERAGACRHDMSKIRTRLVQLSTAGEGSPR